MTDCCSKVSKSDDDEYRAQQLNYYSCAHTSEEIVTEQPVMLQNGTLKEYQVRTSISHQNLFILLPDSYFCLLFFLFRSP